MPLISGVGEWGYGIVLAASHLITGAVSSGRPACPRSGSVIDLDLQGSHFCRTIVGASPDKSTDSAMTTTNVLDPWAVACLAGVGGALAGEVLFAVIAARSGHAPWAIPSGAHGVGTQPPRHPKLLYSVAVIGTLILGTLAAFIAYGLHEGSVAVYTVKGIVTLGLSGLGGPAVIQKFGEAFKR